MKVINCRDVGFDCEGVVKAETEGEVMQMAAEHAKEVHGLEELTPEIMAAVKAAVHEA